MALANKFLSAGCTATTAAGTNTAKTTAMINACFDAALHAMTKTGGISPGQQQAIAALKADALTNVATVRIAIYGA